jgi:hypothetical protein
MLSLRNPSAEMLRQFLAAQAKLDLTYAAVRQDEFLIDPQEILVDEALNGRWQPHDEQAVEQMVQSFEEEGQLQAARYEACPGVRVRCGNLSLFLSLSGNQ